MLLMSANGGEHTPTHTPNLNDDHTHVLLVVFLNCLLASLLTFWHLSTTARKPTVSVPPQVSEGDNVLFLVHNLPKDIKSLAWFKGQGNTTKKIATYTLHNDLSRRGLAYSNREKIYHNGSMLFEKVTLKDSGFYTLQTYNRHGKNVSTTSVILNVEGK